jgi:hypothetical protein
MDQRPIVKHRSLLIANKTPAVIIKDPAYPTLSRNRVDEYSLNESVRVRLTEGSHQGIEVMVSRKDLAPPPPTEYLPAFVPITILILIVIAAALASVKPLAQALKNRREVRHDEVLLRATFGSRERRPERKPPIVDRTEGECDHWAAWVAAMTARRKVRCAKAGRRTAAT